MGPLELTYEKGKYFMPVMEAYGHCVIRSNGKWKIIFYIIKGI